MRWLLVGSLLAGLVAAPSAEAQRGGSAGHAGGGFSASHSFAPSAPRMSGGFGSSAHFSSGPAFAPRSFNAPPHYNWNVPARTGNSQNRIPYGNWRNSPGYAGYHHPAYPYPSHGYRHPYRPYYYANSTYLVPGLLNSYWDYPSGYDMQDNYAGDQSAQASQVGGDNGNYEPEAGSGDGEPSPEMAYRAQQDVPPPPPGVPEPLPQAAITLVFKDGHSQQVRNYALTKTTLYVLDDAASGRRPEIPLDTIDLAATERTNQESGLDFSIPAGN
jgi:hypothetical protein